MEKTRKCPYCGEEIMADARKCKHCGEWLTDEAEPKQEPVQETGRKEPESQLRNDVLATTAAVNEPIADSVPSEPKETLFKSCFWEQITKHYCDFKGNVDRKTFWVCYLYYSLIMLVTAGISAIAPLAGTILMTVVSLGLLLPFLGLMVRRLHDIGKKGAWILISLVPLVGIIWLLVLLLKKDETQNPNKWSGKDTIITIAMAVVGCGLFFVPTSSFEFNDDSEYDTDSELSLLDETDIKYQISQMQLDLNAKKKTVSNFMDTELKRVFESVQSKEQEYFVDCECLDIISQMENGHVIVEPIEIRGIGYNQALAIVNLKPDKLRNTRVAIGITYEREKSFFSKHRINNLIINSMLFDNGQALRQCMIDWLESESFLQSREGQLTPIEFVDINGESHTFIEGDYAGYFEDGTGYYEDLDNNWYWINAEGIKYFHPYETECIYDEYGNYYCDEVDEGYDYDDTNTPQNTEKEQSTKDESKFVVIDATELRLRLAPSTSSETLKWGDGSNRHPEVGEKFRLLDESGDFYKIDFNGNNVWVSKQYTHIELRKQKGENDQLEIGSGQSENDDKADEIFQVVEEMPVFPGGETKLLEYISNNIQYPQVARETGIQGRVFIGFVVEPDGSISNVKLLRGIGGGCDEEAIRVVKSMPKWKPGKQHGKVVRVSYQIPISF